jgi:hypothetical protein
MSEIDAIVHPDFTLISYPTALDHTQEIVPTVIDHLLFLSHLDILTDLMTVTHSPKWQDQRTNP